MIHKNKLKFFGILFAPIIAVATFNITFAHDIEHPINVSPIHPQLLGPGGTSYFIQLNPPPANDSDPLRGYCSEQFSHVPDPNQLTDLVFTVYGGQVIHLSPEMCPNPGHYIWLVSPIEIEGFWTNAE